MQRIQAKLPPDSYSLMPRETMAMLLAEANLPKVVEAINKKVNRAEICIDM